ncbi:MAG: hypothetical protein ACTSPV_14885 [Candidatus Hodarchaeales archaeon]
MTTLKSAEEIRKLELSLEELVSKFTGRIQLIREDLRSLINEIETLKNYIGDRRRQSNEYTREISDLTNDLQTFNQECSQLQKEIASIQEETDQINEQMLALQSDLIAIKNELGRLEAEQASLSSTLKSLELELASLDSTHRELQPKFENRMKIITEELEKLEKEKKSLANRFKAMRILCKKDYIHSPEVGLVKFLANKPSPNSTLTEIRSALGMDENTLKRVLNGLASMNVLEFDELKGKINILTKIDLFDLEV